MQKGIKFKIYPNSEQQNLINKTLGCCRLIYNRGLSMRNEAYANGNKIGYSQTSAMLTELKRCEDFAFLKAVDSIALQQSLRDLDRGFLNFFQKRAAHPAFKSKHNRHQSYRTVNQGGNIRIVGRYIRLPKLGLVKICQSMEVDEGELIWGTTITKSYFPKDNNYLFDVDENLTEWLRKYSKDPDETYVRGFLGRMLFSGDESLKQARVISGGEKVRCVLAKMMLSGANFLIFDEPTNHLDMESITSVNDGMSKFKGNILFTSHDHQLTQTVANRIIDIKADKVIDREVTYNEYLGIE